MCSCTEGYGDNVEVLLADSGVNVNAQNQVCYICNDQLYAI